MKKIFNKLNLLSLASLYVINANAGVKEGGNALVRENGISVYSENLCIQEEPLKVFVKKKNVLQSFELLEKTLQNFHPKLKKKVGTNIGIRVCLTNRNIGPLLGLTHSEQRVAGYIPEYRGNRRKFKSKSSYIIISEDYLNSNPNEEDLARILFAETLHEVYLDKGYSSKNLAIEDAMRVLVKFQDRDISKENKEEFQWEFEEIGFSIASIPENEKINNKEIEAEAKKALIYAGIHEANEDWLKTIEAYNLAQSMFEKICIGGSQKGCFDMHRMIHLRKEAQSKYDIEHNNIFARMQRDHDRRMIKKCKKRVYRFINSDTCDYYSSEE